MKYHIISVSHIIKSIQTIIKYNIMHIVYTILNTILIIVYKIEDFDCYAYTQMGGNLCKYAHYIAIKLTK